MAVDYAPPESLAKPMEVPTKLLMGAGPSNAADSVLKAGSLPLLGHLHKEFIKIMDDVKEGIQYAFQTKNPLTFAISGTGHAGMEAAMCNLVERGDRVLVGVNGIWGERAADMAARQGGEVRKFSTEAGSNFTLSEIEAALSEHKPAILFLVQGESSTGVVQPLDGVGALCVKHDCLLVIDTVASLGGEPFYMDRWQVDVVYTGSQKVLGAPPGTAPISFGPRAVSKIAARTTPISSFYFDANWLANYWGCDQGPRKYHHTAPISSIYALREALALLANEGLEASWNRHRRCRDLLIAGLAKLNLQPLAQDPDARLTCITAVRVPDGVDWSSVTGHAMSQLVEIAGGLGPTLGKIWRVGLMGRNASEANVERVLRVLSEGLAKSSPLMGRL